LRGRNGLVQFGTIGALASFDIVEFPMTFQFRPLA
jgi:hypothetical protein